MTKAECKHVANEMQRKANTDTRYVVVDKLIQQLTSKNGKTNSQTKTPTNVVKASVESSIKKALDIPKPAPPEEEKRKLSSHVSSDERDEDWDEMTPPAKPQ